MRWFKTRKAEEREARHARQMEAMRIRWMYSPLRNPLIRISLGLKHLAEREAAFRENDCWTQDMLNKSRGLGTVSQRR